MEPILRLSELKLFKDKLDFIKSQKELFLLQIYFFSKKTIIKSLGLIEYFDQLIPQNILTTNNFHSIEEGTKEWKTLKSFFDFHTYTSGYAINITNNNNPIGVIFSPFKTPPSSLTRSLVLNFKNQIENQIEIKDIEQKLSNTNKELSNKMLEIESLIDVTEIINNQDGLKQSLFENILITILSILNASKGMILLKDEKSS